MTSCFVRLLGVDRRHPHVSSPFSVYFSEERGKSLEFCLIPAWSKKWAVEFGACSVVDHRTFFF